MKSQLALLFLFSLLLISCKKNNDPSLEIYITQNPDKYAYWEGETLNLEGLKIGVSEDGDYREVGFDDFEKEGFITEPSNGEILSSSIDKVQIKHKSISGIGEISICVRKKVISLVSVENVSETPFIKPSSCIVHNDSLFVITENSGLYAYSFNTKTWSLIKSGVAVPRFFTVQGFVKDNTWVIVNFYNGGIGGYTFIYFYDFITHTFKSSPVIDDFSWKAGALYSRDTLFLYDYSDYALAKRKMFRYDFTQKQIVDMHRSSGLSEYNEPNVYRNVLELNNEKYIIIETDVYKFNNNTKSFEKNGVADAYGSYWMRSGVNFKFQDYIIFGNGGDYFIYYNPITKEKGNVYNQLLECRDNVLGFEYNNEIYTIGGQKTLDDETTVFFKTLDKLVFEKTNTR